MQAAVIVPIGLLCFASYLKSPLCLHRASLASAQSKLETAMSMYHKQFPTPDEH